MKRIVLNNAGYNEILLDEMNVDNIHLVAFGGGSCGYIIQNIFGEFQVFKANRTFTERIGWSYTNPSKKRLIEYLIYNLLYSKYKSIGVFECSSQVKAFKFITKRIRG